MNRMTLSAWTIAAAVCAFACSNANTARTADTDRTGQPPAAGAGTAGTSGTAAANTTDRNSSPVTLVGCLQKGNGRSDYILTEVNTTRTTVGTSGSAGAAGSAADVVGREQMRSASHAYRLDGDRDHLEPLVGKQVRVQGTLAHSADLNEHDSAGKIKERDRSKIDEGDLAKVDVASIDSVGDSCGGKARK